MSDEDTEKRIAFIIEQQAQSASDSLQLGELQAKTEQLVGTLASATIEGFRDVNAKIDALADSQIRLTDAQFRTDENLRNLIAVVDRNFSEGRNGERRTWTLQPRNSPSTN